MIDKIIEAIKSASHILLLAHENPDGDAIGSLVGMANICRYFKVAHTIITARVPEEYVFLTKHVPVKSSFEEAYDTLITLDCGDVSRLAELKNYFDSAAVTINIDHHATNNSFGVYNYVEKEASSTCELVYNIAGFAKVPLTEELCKALYAGIVTDTGGFMYSATKPSTLIAAAKLMETPFDFTDIYYRLMHQKTEKTVLLQAIAVNRLSKLNDGKVFLSYLEEQDLSAHHADREDASSIVSYIKNIQGCEVAVFIYPSSIEGAYKMSFRSNAPYNVAEAAAVFGGGGHIRAAGATAYGTIDEVIEQIKKALNILNL